MFSTAMGFSTTASGFHSTALGSGTIAKALGSLSIGMLNDDTDNPGEFYPDLLDRLFQIGNGNDPLTRSNAFTVLRNGNTGIGTTTPSEKLDVNGNVKCVSLIETSDSRLKKDIVPIQNSLQKITQLNGYNYHWKNENYDTGLQTGAIAQEVQKLFPELVKEDKEGMLSVNYSGLIPVLIESTKELKQQIDQLKKQNEEILLALKQLQEKNK